MIPQHKKEALRILDESWHRSGEDRRVFLDGACGNNAQLRREVDSLIEAAEEAGGFLSEPLLSLPRPSNGELRAGDTIGQYRILRSLGRGGMGVVYLAVRDEPDFDVQVAIKVVRPDRNGQDVLDRFFQEQGFLAQLDHPNIVRPFDRGTTGAGSPYLVMEYVQGVRIDRYCESRKLSTAERLGLFRKVCSSVHFAHQNLIVHRDLKPANILVTPQGEPKLLDFGIARLVEPSPFSTSAETLRQTTSGFLGTLRYASPEQVKNDAVTTASDVYSLGILLYELLTGHYPFQKWSHSFLYLSRAICEEDPEKPSTAIGIREEVRSADGEKVTLTPERVSATRGGDPGYLKRRLSGDLDSIVLKALSKDSRHRYASAEELSEDLGRHLDGLPVSAREATFGYQLGKFFRRHTAKVVPPIVIVLLIIVFGFAALWLWQREEEAKEARERALFVQDYLSALFELRNPGAEGSDVTARQLVDDGVADLEKAMRMADLPEEERDRLKSQLPSDLPGLMDAFGWAYYGLGAYDEAEKWLAEALSRRRESGDPPDADLVITLLHLSAVRSALGQQDDASTLRAEALEILEGGRVDDLRLAQLLNQMALPLTRRGDLEAAAEVWEVTLAMKRRLLGDSDASVAIGLTNLGGTLERLGRYEEAERAYRESLDIKTELYGEDSEELATVQNDLAVLLRDLGLFHLDRREQHWSEAEDLFRRSLEARRRAEPAKPERAAIVLNNWALLEQYRGHLEEAKSFYDEALEIFRDRYGEGDRAVGVVLRNRATLHQAAGRPAEAEGDARQALQILGEAMNPGHWRLADAENVLGGCLLDLGRMDEAAPLIERSLPVIEAAKGEGSRTAWEARERLERLQAAFARGAEPGSQGGP